MTDYNDGKWHGWNGGECPVHPLTIVEVALIDSKPSRDYAQCWYWDAKDTRVAAFRVVKEYRQPREVWVPMYGDHPAGWAFDTEQEARGICPNAKHVKLFREVMEDEA